MKKLLSFTMILTLLITIGCTDESNELTQLDESSFSLIDFLAKRSLTSKHDTPPIWADCDPYTGLVVPATFKPTSDSFDELYVMPVEGYSFKGKPLISDSKPGDQDYNGGRWHLNMYIGMHPEAYADACSEEDIRRISMENGWDMNDFLSTDNYFGCPLKKAKK